MKRTLVLAFVLVLAGCKKPGVGGDYAGKITEGDVTYDMKAELTPKGGTVSYGAPFDCKGTWSFVSHDEALAVWMFKEKVTSQGPKECATGGTVVITETGNGGLFYSQSNAHGPLTRK